MASGHAPLDTRQLERAFAALDARLPRSVTLIVGGGSAMMLAYGLPVRTTDVDAYPRDGGLEDLQPAIREVAREQGLPNDWINPWYETFAYVLPPDYGARLRQVFRGERLGVMALGVEDLLVMKCFAGREKDVSHARALLKRQPELGIVERRLQDALRPRGEGGGGCPRLLRRPHGGCLTPLQQVPSTEDELARLYHELAAIGARTEGRRRPWRWGKPSPEELVVLAAQAARHDPRLLWVTVELLAREYGRLNPLLLRRAALQARWPAALAVALEFARRAAGSAELDDYARFVTAPIGPAEGERFFLGGHAFGGALARRDAEESLAEYKRWGYLGREEPFSKELGARARGTLGRTERMNLLRRLAERRGSVTSGEYAAAVRGRVTARQLSRDLRDAPFLEKEGRTRGTRYRLVDAPAPRPGG